MDTGKMGDVLEFGLRGVGGGRIPFRAKTQKVDKLLKLKYFQQNCQKCYSNSIQKRKKNLSNLLMYSIVYIFSTLYEKYHLHLTVYRYTSICTYQKQKVVHLLNNGG